jgi:solute carrier family 13 (sodium-dependent dicarboxylate transporter), member 2/3/5
MNRHIRNLVPWLSGPIAFGTAWLALAGQPDEQRAVGGVFAWTVAWWITEPVALPVTTLAAAALLVLLGGQDERLVTEAFGDPVVPLFLGGFLLAKAMEVTRLAERVAWTILATRWASASPSRLLFALGAVACGISLIVSNTATTAMLLPIGLGLLKATGKYMRGSPYTLAIMLMLTWGSSVAVGVPIGTPPNMIALSYIETEVGVRIGFLQWAAFGMPITVLMLIGAWLVLRVMYRETPADTNNGASMIDQEPAGSQADIAAERLAALGPVSVAEKSTLVAFLVALVLWTLPDVTGLALGPDHAGTLWLSGRVTLAVGAVIAAFLLFVLPGNGSGSVLAWTDAAGIDWGTIILFGGGLALGRAMSSSGLAASIGSSVAQLALAESLWGLTALAIGGAILLSEVGSNTASANILVPVVIGVADSVGLSPIAPVLGVALGASLGFMMPVSTPPNAIVYGSGLVPAREMMRAGLVIDILGFVVTWSCLRLLLPVLGLV